MQSKSAITIVHTMAGMRYFEHRRWMQVEVQ